jgi:hypothetical protein
MHNLVAKKTVNEVIKKILLAISEKWKEGTAKNDGLYC